LNRGTRRQAVFSLMKLLTVVAAILIILLLGAQPTSRRAKLCATEMAAMKTITTIHTAQTQYFSQYGKFAGSLAELGPPATGEASASAADLIPASLAQTGESSGYRYILVLTPKGSTINASPALSGASGSHTFFSDQTMRIHQHAGPEPATATDPELNQRK
jgi:hypothetical protein